MTLAMSPPPTNFDFVANPVPAGYKQTEVGVIPEDWSIKKVGAFSSIITGPFGTLLKASEYSKGHGVPLISVGEIREGYLRISDETPRVSEEVTKRLPQYLLRKNDIVFGRKGGVERSALIKKSQDSWFLGSDGISIRPSNRLSAPYLGLQFQSHRIKNWLIKNSIGTTMPSLNQSILQDAVIPLPPTKAEQEAIAEALSDADAWIAALEQLIAKKRRIQEGAMQDLLTGKRRLPGFDGEWVVKTLGELGSFSKGSGVRKGEANSGTLPCVRYGEIYTLHNDFLRTFVSHISNEVANKAKRLKKGDILFAGSGETREEIGKCIAFLDDIEAYAGGDIVIFSPDGVDSKFLGYLLNTAEIADQKACKGQGDAVVHISAKALASIEIKVPNLSEQTAIATVLADMDAEIEALEVKLAKARQIKQSMMQELLTGRTRLISPKNAKRNQTQENHSVFEKPAHNRQFEEAVIIAMLTQTLATEEYPIGRTRRVKLTYLWERHQKGVTQGYLKKAAGPYNPNTRYQGPESIALKNGYVRKVQKGTYSGFVAGPNISKAEDYLKKWHGEDFKKWLKQFKYTKTAELELLATVDMAMVDINASGDPIQLETVKQVIENHPEWKAKLDRDIFSDTNIARAIHKCSELFRHA